MGEEIRHYHLMYRKKVIEEIIEFVSKMQSRIEAILNKYKVPYPIRCVYYNFIFDYIYVVLKLGYITDGELIERYVDYCCDRELLYRLITLTKRYYRK